MILFKFSFLWYIIGFIKFLIKNEIKFGMIDFATRWRFVKFGSSMIIGKGRIDVMMDFKVGMKKS